MAADMVVTGEEGILWKEGGSGSMDGYAAESKPIHGSIVFPKGYGIKGLVFISVNISLG